VEDGQPTGYFEVWLPVEMRISENKANFGRKQEINNC
jgi:hypothetical protein